MNAASSSTQRPPAQAPAEPLYREPATQAPELAHDAPEPGNERYPERHAERPSYAPNKPAEAELVQVETRNETSGQSKPD